MLQQRVGVEASVEPAALMPLAEMDLPEAEGRAVVRQQERRERLWLEWEKAKEQWLDAKEAKSGSQNTRRTYETSVRQFFDFLAEEYGDVMPWEVGGVHVLDWQQSLRESCAESTVNLRLSALSSLYQFCDGAYTVRHPRTGRAVSLCSVTQTGNPFDGSRIERGDVTPYGKATFLSVAEMRALLNAVDQATLIGLRDYALLATYFYTGRRSGAIRRLRWGDLEQDGGRVYYAWENKAKEGVSELPLPAYNAIEEYLRADGRLGEMEEDEYIFQPIDTSAMQRLPNVDGEWEGPLSSQYVNRVVKKWARRAGLKWKKISTHTLRHSAARVRRELGCDLKTLQDFLGHSNLQTTQIYVENTSRRKDTMWAQVEALIEGQGGREGGGEV